MSLEKRKFAYHVTPTRNLPSIMEHGLIPTIGENAASVREDQARVYLLEGLQEVENALMNWLGVALSDETSLSLLGVVCPERTVTDGAGYESTVTQTIAPEHIHLLTDNLDQVDDLGRITRPFEARQDAFWRWFGESRVVDAQGYPLVLYHGTGYCFASF